MASENLNEYEGICSGDTVEFVEDEPGGMYSAGEQGVVDEIVRHTDVMFPGVKVYVVMDGADEPTEAQIDDLILVS